MIGGVFYAFVITVVRIAMFFWHPIFHVKGRENIPRDGRLMICCNHSGMADPIWLIIAMRLGHIPRIMAKKEVLDVPVLGWFLNKIGIIGVDRGGNDVKAIKTGLRALQDDQQMMVFPEGTRVKDGQRVEPKRGALLMAQRTNTPILPVYLTVKRHPFSPLTCIFGEPYYLNHDGKKMTDEELEQETKQLMEKIYALGDAQ